MPRITREDVAARAGVSTAVVSYVMNNAFLNPPLTTIKLPTEAMGAQAALSVMSLARGAGELGLPPPPIVLPVELPVRGSTARAGR